MIKTEKAKTALYRLMAAAIFVSNVAPAAIGEPTGTSGISNSGATSSETTTQTITTTQTTATPDSPLNVFATSRTDAILKARIGAGRVNPFAQPAGALKPLFEPATLKQPKALPKVHLPPPPKYATLAPPPPPTEPITTPGIAERSVGHAGQLASDTALPEPPEKPLISEKMRLVGVLADKAFFTFTDLGMRRANKFPSTVVLANGEQFESVHLISVEPNSVVLEEDGERVTKDLERIR
jgi:hypothetical protein